MQTLDSSTSLSSLDIHAYQVECTSVDSDSLEGYEFGKELLQTRRHSVSIQAKKQLRVV